MLNKVLENSVNSLMPAANSNTTSLQDMVRERIVVIDRAGSSAIDRETERDQRGGFCFLIVWKGRCFGEGKTRCETMERNVR